MLGLTIMFVCSCSVIRQIAADTFALLSVCCDDGGNLQLLTPFHFLALLDPKAQWFCKWMVCMCDFVNVICTYIQCMLSKMVLLYNSVLLTQHGYYGRTEVIYQLKSFPLIVSTNVTIVKFIPLNAKHY